MGLPIPGPWSLRTVDPNHVLQDEDSLCQDLQGLSQLLHPLTLEGRKQPGSGPFCIRVHAVPVPPHSCLFLVTIITTTAIIHYVPGVAFEFLFTDKKPEAQRGEPGSSGHTAWKWLSRASCPGLFLQVWALPASQLPAFFPCVPFLPENTLPNT